MAKRKKYRLYDDRGEVRNLDSRDGAYSEKQLEEAKKNLTPRGSWKVFVLLAIVILLIIVIV